MNELKIEHVNSQFHAKSNSIDNKLLIAYSTDEVLNIYCIVFDKQENKWKFDESCKDIQINPSNYFTDIKLNEISYLFSDKNNYLIFSTQNSIKYINIFNQDIICEYQFNLSTSSQDQRSLDIKTIPSSDDTIILYKNFKFIYVRFDNDYQTVNSTEKTYDDSLIDEYKINGSLLSVLLETTKETNQFLINKLSIENGIIEMKEIFKEKLELNSLKFFCLTENLNYLILYKTNRVLNLYRIKDNSCIATVPMFSEILVMLATSQFIVMAINEKRIVSYLITDPTSSDYSYKIQSLESR